MIKQILFCALALLTVVGVYAGAARFVGTNDHYMDYHVRNNQYAVIYININNVTEETMKERALTRAAEVAKSKGYRYFKVMTSKEVYVTQTDEPREQAPSNLYQEMIIEKGFSRNRTAPSRQNPSATGVFPAYKNVIALYHEAPSGDYEHVCDYIWCKKAS